jgi:uncharacterized membrane protein YeaQ/YmgE (transglycosylase-associated protein family)
MILDQAASMHFIGTILVGILIGWIAGILVRGRGLGLIADLIVGVLGAYLAGLIAPRLNIDVSGFLRSLCASVLGAVLLLLVLRLFKSDK